MQNALQIILLAAGLGRRMGGPNKLLLPYRGRTVLETTLGQLCEAAIGPVCVVTGHAQEAIAEVVRRFPVEEVFNPDYASGMTSSIQAGIRASAAECAGYMICLADMPEISPAAYRLLAESFLLRLQADPRAIVLPRFNGSKGNPVVFSAAYRAAILRHHEPEGCRGIVQAHTAHVHWAEMPEDGVLLDLDTPEDYQALSD